MIFGLGLTGIALPFTIIPAYQELFDAVTSKGRHFEQNQLSDTLIGLFNACFSLGLIFGPLISSYIFLATDFRYTVNAQAIFVLAFFLLYFAIVWVPMRLWPEKVATGKCKDSEEI